MGTTLIIVYAPGLDFAPRILQGHEPVLVQTFLSQPAIERLHSGIVRRCSRPGKVVRHFMETASPFTGGQHGQAKV